MSRAASVADRLEPSASSGDDDELAHVVCCDPDVALCGADVAGAEWSTRGEPCVVCTDLDRGTVNPCTVCGEEAVDGGR